ncbi:MAG: HAMP domain-containing protein [Thermodesulfobacteriota bacterium]
MNRLMVLLFLLGLVVVSISAKFFFDATHEIQSASVEAPGSPAMSAALSAQDNVGLLETNRTRFAVVLVITVSWFALAMYLIARRIVVPANKMAVAARQMLQGNFGSTLPNDSKGDLGDVGKLLNDMSANFQEILLLTGTAVGNSLAALERLDSTVKSDSHSSSAEMQKHIEDMKRHLGTLQTMVQEFTFYQARFDGRAVFGDVADTQGTGGPAVDRENPAMEAIDKLVMSPGSKPKGNRHD